MYEEKRGSYSKHLDFVILDFIMLQVTLILVYMIRFGVSWVYSDLTYLHIAGVLGLFDLVSMYFLQSYKNILKRGYIKELRATMIHVTLVVILTIIYTFLIGIGEEVSRFMILQLWFGGMGLLYLGRVLLKYWLHKNLKNVKETRHVVLVSSLKVIEETMKTIKSIPYRDYLITKIILIGDTHNLEEFMGVRSCSTMRKLYSILRRV